MRYLKSSKINFEVLIKMIILLGYALLFYVVIASGNVKYYVHPRIVPYMKFGIVIFAMVSISMAFELFKPQRIRFQLGRYLFFIIPLIFAFSIPPKIPDISSISLNNINKTDSNGSSLVDEYNAEPHTYTNGDELQEYESSEISQNTTEVADNSNKLSLQDDTIVMDDKYFAYWLVELHENFDLYKGKNIQVVGFVFKDEQFAQNEFVPARYLMSCCAADAAPVGIMCNYKDASQLKKDSWVKVTGKVQEGEFNGQKMPVIITDSVELTNKPKAEFIYP